jgi:hypothetical protein
MKKKRRFERTAHNYMKSVLGFQFLCQKRNEGKITFIRCMLP